VNPKNVKKGRFTDVKTKKFSGYGSNLEGELKGGGASRERGYPAIDVSRLKKRTTSRQKDKGGKRRLAQRRESFLSLDTAGTLETAKKGKKP